jgi:hypothetical protein
MVMSDNMNWNDFNKIEPKPGEYFGVIESWAKNPVVEVVSWDGDDWRDHSGRTCNVTFWLPIPEMPQEVLNGCKPPYSSMNW